jgi:hypothetical protein
LLAGGGGVGVFVAVAARIGLVSFLFPAFIGTKYAIRDRLGIPLITLRESRLQQKLVVPHEKVGVGPLLLLGKQLPPTLFDPTAHPSTQAVHAVCLTTLLFGVIGHAFVDAEHLLDAKQ